MFRRLLLIAKLSDSGTEIVISFVDGVITLNHEGKGNNTAVAGSEVTLIE